MAWTAEDEHGLSTLAERYRLLLERRRAAGSLAAPLRSGMLFVGAAELYRARRLRDCCFPAAQALFGEPAWDMLLDLYDAHQRRQTVTVSSACIAAGVPLTTARRHLVKLEGAGMVRCLGCGSDARTRLVALTPGAVAMMSKYLERL